MGVNDTTCEYVVSDFYNLELLHVEGIHMCEQKFTTLAVGVMLILMVVPLMNMRACRIVVRE